MSKSLIFFGSGPVAAQSLQLLIGSFDIEAVVTKPTPSHHRHPAPVLELCKKHNLTTHTPADRQGLSQLFASLSHTSQVGLVIDYGIIINQDVIDSFKFGIINSHFSLLPQWRGADPITFAVLSGQQQTGVSLMKIVAKMDEGPIIAQGEYTMPSGITTPQLTNDLISLSDKLLKKFLPQYLDGTITPQEQSTIAPGISPTYSRKLTKQDGLITWDKPAQQIEREVRAFIGWPKSRATIHGKPVIITKSRVATSKDDGSLVMPCNPGWLEVLQLTAPSGKSMSGADFLRGYSK